MDLSILIVTYNSQALVGPLMAHLRDELNDLDAEVLVVDNASRDGTLAALRRDHPWVHVIESRRNLGFAAGNNLAARHARGRYLLLLNPDALPATGALRQALNLLEAHPEVGLAGGQLRAPDGSRQPSARMFPTLRDEFFTLAGLAARFPRSRLFARLDRRWADPDQRAEVDWIPGAFVFVPARVWTELGGFDERFFMYYEEVDLCRRLREAGRTVMYWPELQATHIGGASARTVQNARVSRTGSQLETWRMRSALLYYRKQHGWLAAAAVHGLERGWHGLRRLKARLQGRHAQAGEFAQHCQQLGQAWRDTDGGRHSPATPW
jgi:GT2 family glycosyltransferase